MDLLEQTKNLCKLYNIIPARSRGQNFLIREDIYDDVEAAADLKPDDIVLEVGPGLGFLTAKLALKTKKVLAVEIDKKLVEALRARLESQRVKNVEVVNEDILKMTNIQFPITKQIPNSRFQANSYKIVANLPYNITSIFLRIFLETEKRPELMVLLLQKEVAERICAKAGEMSLLAVSVQFYAKPEIVEIVKKEYFWPEPEVDSAIVKIAPHKTHLLRQLVYQGNGNPPSPLYQGGNKEENPPSPLYQGGKIEQEFFRLVKFGFSAKRKMLKNNLSASWRIDQAEVENKLKSAGLNPKIRAQELSVADWLKLFSVFKNNVV